MITIDTVVTDLQKALTDAQTLQGQQPPPPPPPPPPGGPAWLAGAAVGQWIAIPGTKLVGSDVSSQIAAGLTNAARANIGYGRPDFGIMSFSGGAFKPATSELLIHGGGGAQAWGGNDIRALRLTDNSPAWRTVVNPSSSSVLWPREAAGQPLTPHPYTQDGKPNPCHAYSSMQYVPSQDKFYRFYTSAVFEDDSGFFKNTNAASLATGTWDAQGTHPDNPYGLDFNGPTCIDPAAEKIYVGCYNEIACYAPAANSGAGAWSRLVNNVTQPERGVMAVGGNALLFIRNFDNPFKPQFVDLSTGVLTVGSFTGVPLPAAAPWAAGFVYDPGLAKWLSFSDDGSIYTITRTDATHCDVALLATTGTPPPPHASGVHSGGSCAIWGRMQYVPALKGVVIAQCADNPVYFLRTA